MLTFLNGLKAPSCCRDLTRALVGFGSQWGSPTCAIYSVQKILEILGKDMDDMEAREFYHHNIECLGVGDQTPIMMEVQPNGMESV